jgi:hypothetical protein
MVALTFLYFFGLNRRLKQILLVNGKTLFFQILIKFGLLVKEFLALHPLLEGWICQAFLLMQYSLVVEAPCLVHLQLQFGFVLLHACQLLHFSIRFLFLLQIGLVPLSFELEISLALDRRVLCKCRLLSLPFKFSDDAFFFVLIDDLIQDGINLPAIDDMHRDPGFLVHVGRDFGNVSDCLHAVDHLTKDHMFAVQVRTLLQSDKELTGVGMFTAVGHGEEAGVSVAADEILVFEVPFWIDRVTASAIAFREIATLAHKAFDHSVDLRT